MFICLYAHMPFGDRLVVGHQVLVLATGVRIPVPEPIIANSPPLSGLFFVFLRLNYCWFNDNIRVKKRGVFG